MPQTLCAPVGHADRLALDRAIAGKILDRETSGLARIVLHGLGNVARDVALVEGARSVTGDRSPASRQAPDS